MRSFLLLVTLASFNGLSLLAQSDAGFVDQLTAEERAVLQVDRMTPAQLAALEAAARRFAGDSDADPAGTVATAPDLAAALAETQAKLEKTKEELASAKASLEQQPKEERISMLQRAKVLLTPGTQIEYDTVESRLTEPFRGWKVGTLFRLENGQTWRVTSGSYWAPQEPAGKAVTITPGTLGSFFMRFEGVRQSPRVEVVSR